MPHSQHTEVIKICRMNRTVFQYSLLWPNDGTELNPGILYKVKILGFFLSTGILAMSTTVHFILTIKNGEGIDPEELALIIAGYGTYYMVCAYIKNQHQLILLLREMSVFKKFGKPPGFEEKNKQLDRYAVLLVVYSFIGTALYGYMKFLEKDECQKFHLERGTDGKYCGLIAHFWLPFNIDYFPVFQLCFLYSFLAGHLLFKMCMHISFNALEIVHHIVLRIEHLRWLIQECLDKGSYEVTRIKLQHCILYHNDILNLTKRLDETFFHSMFGHFALTATICACLEKQIVDGKNAYAGAIHFVGWIIALFIGCVGGQDLLNANEMIPEALWTSKWYLVDSRTKKDFLFMLLDSQKNFYLRAGPFGILSYPLFVSVLKASYSILCLLTS